jgi:pilus assembly protein CpaF
MSMLQERLQRGNALPAPLAPTSSIPQRADEAELLIKVREALLAQVSKDDLADGSEENRKRLKARITVILRTQGSLPRVKEAAIAEEIMKDLFEWGPITDLLRDPDITEIMVNRHDQIYVERNGVLQLTDIRFRDNEHILAVIQKVVGPIGRRIDESSPMVDGRLPDGSRVNAIIPPLAIKGPALTIRRFGRRLTAQDYLDNGSIDESSLAFLADSVRARANILITGGTGTGKSTFLNVLSAYVPEGERIITIEDSAELQLQQPHTVSLESRPANIEGKGSVTIRDLVRNALRMRPDRIIVGEARGPEALDLIQAMNTGHEGSLATIHANTPQDAIHRLAVMMMMAGEEIPHSALLQQIASSLDLIVHLSRMRDGSRKVTEISEVGAVENGQVLVHPIFRYVVDPESRERVLGKWVSCGVPKKVQAKYEWRGVPFDIGRFGGETQ